MKNISYRGKTLAALAFAACLALYPLHTTKLQASTPPATFFEAAEITEISNNTRLHQITRVTSAGLLEISVLEIPLDDPYLAVSAFNSDVSMGFKQPTTTLLNANNALAGVNGDFFGLAGTHSVPLGLEVAGGHMSAQDDVVSATFMINDNGAFIDYVRPRVALRLDGQDGVFSVGLVNMVTTLNWPSFLTHGYIQSTESIDARLGLSYKLVVRDGVIVNITHYTVDVPENGFVIIMNPDTFEANSHLFQAGQTAHMLTWANIDLNAIQTAISGDVRLVTAGNIPGEWGGGRAPRTVLGISQDGARLILMTIDGRGFSVGATLNEAAHYIRQFGAYNAINLDGGGSTTMAARLPEQNALSVINTPSDGRQRNVINTIGVVNNSTLGDISSISVGTANGQRNIPVGMVTSLVASGFDDYFNHIPLDVDDIEITLTNAYLADGGVLPRGAGAVTVLATYGDITAEKTFEAVQVVEIIPSVSNIAGRTQISFTGIDNLGRRAALDPNQLNYEVFPANLGAITDGLFVPQDAGNGWARAFTTTASAFIPVSLNNQSRMLLNFDTAGIPVAFSSIPTDNPGLVGFTTDHAAVGTHSLQMTYGFAEGEFTQAAYADFLAPPQANALSYSVQVYGNNSGHWLRGNIIDIHGNTFVIDFTRYIDFTGWRTLTARVPAEAALPVQLERIYAVSLFEAEAATYQLFFDNLRVYEPFSGNAVAVPQGTVARDPLYVQHLGEGSMWDFDITFMGPTSFVGEAPDTWDDTRLAAITAVSRNSVNQFYGGNNDLDIGAAYLTGHYAAIAANNMYVIQMMGGAGGFAATGAAQWGRLPVNLAGATSNNIVIHTNLSPLNFRHAQEFQLFHNLLREQADAGRNIFVVSNGGSSATIDIRDGVRYINLPAKQLADSLNPEFSILRFRLSGDDISYSLERVFN